MPALRDHEVDMFSTVRAGVLNTSCIDSGQQRTTTELDFQMLGGDISHLPYESLRLVTIAITLHGEAKSVGNG